MKQYFSFLLFTLLSMSLKAQPPNNPIFTGGPGDGMSRASWLVAAVNIFAGGHGDGETVGINTVTPNPIYAGGEGDGFSFNTNNALPNNIFVGGHGDGWSAIVLPLGPLPVELISFSAEHLGVDHLVKWSTAAEINTAHFEVQRSADARNFYALDSVVPTGNESLGANYRFTVNDPWSGNNFYRLKITDNDGSFTFSNIVLLKNEGTIKISVFPSPATELIHISIPASQEVNNVKAFVYDVQGRMIIQTSLQTGNINAIPVYHLPAGTYTIRSVIDKQPVYIRFLKQN